MDKTTAEIDSGFPSSPYTKLTWLLASGLNHESFPDFEGIRQPCFIKQVFRGTGQDSWGKTLPNAFILRITPIGTKTKALYGFSFRADPNSDHGEGHFRKGNERVADRRLDPCFSNPDFLDAHANSEEVKNFSVRSCR